MGWVSAVLNKNSYSVTKKSKNDKEIEERITYLPPVIPPRPPDSPLNQRKEEVTSGIPKISTSEQVPVFVKDEKSQEFIINAIMKNDLLKNLDKSQIKALSQAMKSEVYEAGQNIIKEGEAGSHLYVSAEGSFVVYVGNKKVNTFGPGVTFGELAVLYNTKRSATIQVLTQSSVWVLEQQVYQKIMTRTRLQDIDNKVKFLRSNPLLKDVDSDILAKMSDLLKVEFFAPEQCIIRQGDKGDKFYIISGGSVRITRKEPGSDVDKEVGIYSYGKYFGELALLNEDTRQATVTALAPGVECLVLDRIPFIQLLGDLEEIKRTAEDITSVIDGRRSKIEYGYIGLNELKCVGTLGVGGFGRVELVQYKKKKDLVFALKCLKKCYVVEQRQEEHAYNEKKVMMACSKCSFISKLYRTYRDDKYVYFLMEACLGGDLFTVLRHNKRFSENTTRFMTACVVEALQFLHDRGYVYRDLKPENLLLDDKGYIKMIDFGFAKRVGHTGKTWTFSGTPEYVAPEIILNKGHDRAVDCWALGAFIHELIIGRPPFRGRDHMQTYNLILKGINSVHFPRIISPDAKDLVRKLCRADPTERIGYQKKGIEEIKNHKWFEGFDWQALRDCRIEAPIIPSIKGPTDLSNFDEFPRHKSVPPDETSGWDKDF